MALSVGKRKSQRLELHIAVLLLAASALLLTKLIFSTSFVSVVTALMGMVGVSALVWPRSFNEATTWLIQINRRYRWPSLLLVLMGALFTLNCLSEPASAQFFIAAENGMKEWFTTDGVDVIITLVFNVLRGLFLIYLGISLVKVVQAARQDEDWQTLARTPLIILIAMTLGDQLAGLIIGGGATP